MTREQRALINKDRVFVPVFQVHMSQETCAMHNVQREIRDLLPRMDRIQLILNEVSHIVQFETIQDISGDGMVVGIRLHVEPGYYVRNG